MRIYLIAGSNSEPLKQVLEKDSPIEVVCCSKDIHEAFQNLIENDMDLDVLLLTDQGIGSSLEGFARALADFRELVDNLLPGMCFKFITKEPQYSQIFKNAVLKSSSFEVHLVDDIKIHISLLKEICLGHRPLSYEDTIVLYDPAHPSKKNLWTNFKKGNPAPEANTRSSEGEGKDLKPCGIKQTKPRKPANPMRKSTNRIIAVTGHRGSGISSTVSNLAVEAGNTGLKTMIVDLDLIYRGINLYFSKFGEEADLNPDLAFSLVRCMMKPDAYAEHTCIINDNLCLTALAYSVGSNDKMLEHITGRRIIAMLSALKNKFDLVLLDVPIELFRQYPDMLVQADAIAVCMNNSLHSIVSTVRSTSLSCTVEDFSVFKMKSKLVLTKYNAANIHKGKVLTVDLSLKILADLSDSFDYVVECAGIVPYCSDFDRQVDSGRKICSQNSDYKKYYSDLLHNLY